MSKWIPTQDLATLRRLGKLLEELGELQAIAARCIIQGIDEIDPSSGECNRLRLEHEIADVYAQLQCTVGKFGLPWALIGERCQKKVEQMAEWESLFVEAKP